MLSLFYSRNAWTSFRFWYFIFIILKDKWELNRYLLSSISYWIDIFKFDGIRFPNLKDIILVNPKHPGDIKELLLDNSRIEALVFIMFANDVVHQIK